MNLSSLPVILKALMARPRGAFVIIVCALSLSVALNVLLAHRLNKLSAMEFPVQQNHLLQAGTAVPSILAKRIDGSAELIIYQGSGLPTVLYIFTPKCSWCARNLDNLEALSVGGSKKYRIIGLSLSDDGLKEYVANNHLTFPVCAGISKETKDAYHLTGTPETIVVSSEGRVLKNWMGAYVGRNKQEIEAYFHVQLPGLRDVARPEDAHSSLSSQAPMPAK